MSMTEAERAAGAVYRKAKARERKASTAARPKSPKADRGRERDGGFLAYLRRQPCAAEGFGPCDGPIQAAHVSYRVAGIPNSFGRGVKNHDRHANPLCAGHHSGQHGGGERAFWDAIRKDAYETAAAHYAAYLGTDAGSPSVSLLGMTAQPE